MTEPPTAGILYNITTHNHIQSKRCQIKKALIFYSAHLYNVQEGKRTMVINGIEVEQHELSYDQIVKNTLAADDKVAVRFINGLFDDDIPLDARVEWLDKETASEKHTGIVADLYPRVSDKMYAIEIEQDARSRDISIRVFRYSVGGAMLHSTTATKSALNISFPQPCVIFLKSTRSTPKNILWNIEFFDGQKVALQVPTIRLGELSVKEIAERNLFPIGQFYLRKFEKLTKRKVKAFREAAAELLEELGKAVEKRVGPIPYGPADAGQYSENDGERHHQVRTGG